MLHVLQAVVCFALHEALLDSDGVYLPIHIQTPELRVNVAVVRGASHLDVQITLGTLEPVHGILVRLPFHTNTQSNIDPHQILITGPHRHAGPW